MTKRILFSVYGYGLGHATRCHAIMNSLKKKRVKIKVAASGNAYDYFNSKKYKPISISSVSIGSITDSFSWTNTLFANIDLPFTMIRDYYAFKNACSDYNPNIIISDTEPISLVYASMSRTPCIFISNLTPVITEYKHLPERVKDAKTDSQRVIIKALVDNALKNCKKLLSPSFSDYELDSKVINTGLITRALPSDLPSPSIIKRMFKEKDYCLVSFGGAKITEEYYKALLPLLKKIKKKFIVSTNYAVNKVTKVKNVTLYPFIDNYLSYLKLADSVICLSGHSTISECLAFKKPCFNIPIRGHVEQLTNASVVNRRGFGKSFYASKKLNALSLKKSIIDFLKNKDEYVNNIEKAKLSVKGSETAAKSILKI